MTPVKFIKNHIGYNIGQVAAFPDPHSQALINAGIAEALPVPPPAPAPEVVAPKKTALKDRLVKKAA